MKWAGQLMQNCGLTPNLGIAKPSPPLFQIQYREGDTSAYFLANTDRKQEFSSLVVLRQNPNTDRQWHPESGEKTRLVLNDNGEVLIHLQPLESMLIVVDPAEKASNIQEEQKTAQTPVFDLDVSWQVTCHPVNAEAKIIELPALKAINELEEFKDFGGEIIYKTRFETSSKDFTTLVIEEVYETAEVWLNGKLLGLSWWGNNVFLLSNRLKKGKNTLEIKVTTLLANYALSLKENATAQFWTSRYKDKKPVKIGLVGKVSLR